MFDQNFAIEDIMSSLSPLPLQSEMAAYVILRKCDVPWMLELPRPHRQLNCLTQASASILL